MATKTSKTTTRTIRTTKKALSSEEIKVMKKGWSRQQVEFYGELQGLNLMQVISIKHVAKMLLARQRGDMKAAIGHALYASWAEPDMALINLEMLAGIRPDEFDAPKKVRARDG